MKRALSSAFRVVRFVAKLFLIGVLLLLGRGSLALYVWGRGRLCRWIARLYDADPGMYRRQRWKDTRKLVYFRNKRENRGVFACEATGYRSNDLGLFHVDHVLSRSAFPMLAYELWNLRLVRDRVNIKKSDDLSVFDFIWFFITGWNAQSAAVATLFVGASIAWRLSY